LSEIPKFNFATYKMPTDNQQTSAGGGCATGQHPESGAVRPGGAVSSSSMMMAVVNDQSNYNNLQYA
jgi:hypothetical protein